MFSALRRLKWMAARHRFQKMVQSFDDRIEQARADHGRVREIQREKSAYVHQALERRA
jgi:hypothetical protein